MKRVYKTAGQLSILTLYNLIYKKSPAPIADRGRAEGAHGGVSPSNPSLGALLAIALKAQGLDCVIRPIRSRLDVQCIAGTKV